MYSIKHVELKETFFHKIVNKLSGESLYLWGQPQFKPTPSANLQEFSWIQQHVVNFYQTNMKVNESCHSEKTYGTIISVASAKSFAHLAANWTISGRSTVV